VTLEELTLRGVL